MEDHKHRENDGKLYDVYLVKLKTATSSKQYINKQKENENPSIETF